ncbi:MAG: hypothetical protein ACO1SV_17530 [Fimbriimonas sp.]
MTSDPVARYLAHRSARLARAGRLRPMRTGEVIDSALRIYQRLGTTFLRTTVGSALLCLAATAFVLSYVLPGMFTTRDSASFVTQIGEVLTALLLAVFVGGPLFLIGLSYTTAIVVSLTSDDVLGEVPDVEAAHTITRKRLWTLFRMNMRELVLSLSGVFIATAIMLLGSYIAANTPDSDVTAGLVTLVGVLGMFGGFLVFLFFVGRDALAPPAVVLEDADPAVAARRSRDLQRSHPIQGSGSGPILGVYSLLSFLVIALWGGLSVLLGLLPTEGQRFLASLPFGPLWTEAYNLIPAFVTLWTLMPVWASVVTVTYYDRRIRLEGFDIEVLAKEISRGRASRFDV